MVDSLTTFGTWLRRRRADAGLATLPALQDELLGLGVDVSINTLSRWETGSGAPSRRHFLVLLDRFATSESDRDEAVKLFALFEKRAA